MRVLLTGANGFIGAHLTAALIAAGHEVVAAVRNPAALAARCSLCSSPPCWSPTGGPAQPGACS